VLWPLICWRLAVVVVDWWVEEQRVPAVPIYSGEVGQVAHQARRPWPGKQAGWTLHLIDLRL